ncbi:MAG: GIY-YIG nuclease family protein [Rhodospirillales bacterium]|nr:GIY-YIG nuclease family protein [Rhodospirillales bacterium]
MPVNGNKLAFAKVNVENAPDEPGVYVLYVGGHLIYYGSTEKSIRSRLQDHLAGREGKCTTVATVYGSEVSLNPLRRERELLIEYKSAYGVLPHCNNKMP